MGKVREGDKISNFQMPEPPPPYNSAPVFQPAEFFLDYNLHGYTSEIPLDTLYGVDGPGDEIFYVPCAQGGSGNNNVDLLWELLAGQRKLTIYQSPNHGFKSDPTICQILGPENQIVMSTLQTTVDHSGDGNHTSTTLRFSDQEGNVLLITQQTGGEFTVMSGDRLIGFISRIKEFSGARGQLKGRSSNGTIAFEVALHGSEYYFQADHGRTIAVARMNEEIFELEFKDSSLDIQSRALVMTGAYYLFQVDYIESTYTCAKNTADVIKIFGLVLLLILSIIALAYSINNKKT